MGILTVVHAENSHRLPLDLFVQKMKDDAWGKLSFPVWYENPDDAWVEFTWRGKSYFAWKPGFHTYYLHLFDGASLFVHETKPNLFDPENQVQVTFLQIMLTVALLAGGPVYVGNDASDFKTPESAEDAGREFALALPLDYLIEKWRDVYKCANVIPMLAY